MSRYRRFPTHTKTTLIFVLTLSLIIERPQLIETPKATSITLREGDHLSLSCQTAGKPEPVVIWYKNDELIATDVHTYMILKLTTQDTGSYRCTASNIAGSVSQITSVTVSGTVTMRSYS